MPRASRSTTLSKQNWAQASGAADISSFAAKAPEHAYRLAALMTLFEDPQAGSIDAETMSNACEIVKFHLGQFKYLCVAGSCGLRLQSRFHCKFLWREIAER